MYYLPQPPFLVAVMGVLIAIACGSAFQNLLAQRLRESYQNVSQESSFKIEFKNSAIATTYGGICLGVWIFLGGGFLILGFGIIPSLGVALLLTIGTASLVWNQINDVLLQLKEGGSASLELS